MKAAVMSGFRVPLVVQEMPEPVPGPGDAVIEVEACGICRSDWHLWQEDFSWVGVNPPFPLVPGHEFGGFVAAIGPEVRNFRPGDRVTVPFHLACGHCAYCQTGRSQLCQAHGFIGVTRHGGYGRLAIVPQADANLVHLPEGVDNLTAAVLGCRFMTAYHGIADKALVRPGEWVAIFGMGGVGLAAVQVAAALGARVVAVSGNEEKLALAREEGAVAALRSGDGAVAAIREMTDGGADISVDAFGARETILPGILSLRKGGRHLQLGKTGQEDRGMVALPVDAMLLQELTVIGSLGCPVTSYPGLLSMVVSGKLNPRRLVMRTIAVEEVNEVLQGMTTYGTRGFNVITAW